MKNATNLITALLFSLIFYKQSIGLNLLIFSFLTMITLVLSNREAFKTQKTILITIGYFTTGFTVFLYHSNLTILANIIAFFALIGACSNHNSSIYIQWINGIYTACVSFFDRQFNSQRSVSKNMTKAKINYAYWFKLIGIPLIFLSIFIGLYQNGNPIFKDIITRIDLSFINIQWILFTILGYYLFSNISNPIQIQPLTKLDGNTGNILEKEGLKEIPAEKVETEKQLGIVLLFLLNILIVFFMVTDLFFLGKLSSYGAPELSQQVHAGINALIVSILIAIFVIIYFFRGNLNFINNNKSLKQLTYLWIFLNQLLIFTIAYKNYLYISSYGLTYKRIGVFVYLTLTLVGLTTTFIKVSAIKNIWYLFRRNTQIAFTIFIFSAIINWDSIITIYNINYAHETDFRYLITLSNNNTFLLQEYSDDNTFDKNVKEEINKKYQDYIVHLNNNSWQELVYDNVIKKNQ